MLVEHGLLCEGLAADAALEGSLLAVHAGVHVQATGVRVRLTAHSTLRKRRMLHGIRIIEDNYTHLIMSHVLPHSGHSASYIKFCESGPRIQCFFYS